MSATVAGSKPVQLEMDDIQSGALHPRPSPYVGWFFLLRIDDPEAGRELLRRLLPAINGGLPPAELNQDAWVAVAFSHAGLRALGVAPETLDSFPIAFRQGMAARAAENGDIGASDPSHWEPPFGAPDLHLAIHALAPDTARLERALAPARRAYETARGIEIIWRQEVHQLPNFRTTFGFRDGLSYPAIEGTGIPGSNPLEPPLKAGEFILGYPDETGNRPPLPQPEILGRNGTYLALRKLHTDVAGWRRFLRAHAASPEEEALLGAKMMGRWPSGAPLALAQERDDPELAADPRRVNAFLYRDDDARGFKCPAGAHIRRANPRDAEIIGVTRLHRIIRRGATYGPPLPEGVLEDDGAERGLLGLFIGAHLERQFEFIKKEWFNDGNFAGYPGEADPVAGQGHGMGRFTIPAQPIRRRITNLPSFVVTRGGEYLFAPGLRALRWLAELDA